MSLAIATNAYLGYTKPVIGPLSFQLDNGQRLGIWGPNGCGKSTLLRYFCNESRLFSGEISIQANIRVAFQPQKSVLPDEMPLTGKEYLQLLDSNPNQAPEKIQRYLDKRIDKISGGQFQSLTTWANLSCGSELVLLDEPTNNLDPAAHQLLAETLLAMPNNTALILVSHNRTFLEQVTDNILVITES